jgi:hypothetical protein
MEKPMEYKDVRLELSENINKIAKRTAWKTERVIDKNSLNLINESDRQATDWFILEKINE